MWECYFKKRDIENCKAYFKKQDEFYFYGDKVTNTLIDNRLPIYISVSFSDPQNSGGEGGRLKSL
mgnify:CR=1 FL=1